jgi:GDP/UDP-N,N'-diacetylbacillosamine 2-epimerase (hydrolysing)
LWAWSRKGIPNLKRVAFLTTARSEYNVSRWVIKEINDDPELDLQVLVGGTHESVTYKEIQNKYPCYYRVSSFFAETKKTACLELSNGIDSIISFFEYNRPDILLINGDRIELMSYILAAVIYRIPIAHIGGGDITEGSIDNETRYAISRYAHLHLVSNEHAKQRLIQSGEDLGRIYNVGQCGHENIIKTEKLNIEETSKQIGLDLIKPTALCCYYPALEPNFSAEQQIDFVLKALNKTNIQTIFIYPCAEIDSEIIKQKINDYCLIHNNCKAFANLENQLFQSVLWHCSFMIGNSSAGVIEMPFLNKWTINVGTRQQGRVTGYKAIIDINYNPYNIAEIIKFCLNNPKQSYIEPTEYPSQKIIKAIKENIDRPDLLYKKILLGENQ